MSEYTHRRLTIDNCLFPIDKKILLKSNFRVFRDRPVLTPGTYTDGLAGTSARFSADVLTRDAENWDKRLVDLDHAIGDSTKIAGHFDPRGYARNAVRGDVYIHKLLPAGTIAIGLIEAGYVKGLSVEILTKEDWNKDEKLFDVREIKFIGLGIVGTPACPDASIVD